MIHEVTKERLFGASDPVCTSHGVTSPLLRLVFSIIVIAHSYYSLTFAFLVTNTPAFGKVNKTWEMCGTATRKKFLPQRQ